VSELTAKIWLGGGNIMVRYIPHGSLHRLTMDSILLRLIWVLGCLQLIYAVPNMQAIRDEQKLDDGTFNVAI
jgi:hypothetical protein